MLVMKKYCRLLLLLLSITSLSVLLIYIHEYNRLRYVLEVFNFFGQPCNISHLQISENVLTHHDWGPVPVWQESENLHVYSAFLNDDNEIKAIVLHMGNGSKSISCYAWYEEQRKPVVGKLKYLKIAQDESTKQMLFWYHCSLRNFTNVPYAVSFSFKNKKLFQLKKISITNLATRKITYNTTICVSPTAYDKPKLLQFLAYHNLLGFNSYIFYGGNIPHRVSKLLTNFSNKLNIDLTFFPWNFPYVESQAVNRHAVIEDCIMRNQYQSQYVVALETDEYIVPSKVFNFNSTLQNVQMELHKLSLPVRHFCIVNDDSEIPMALQNVEYYRNVAYSRVHIFSLHTSILSGDIFAMFNNSIFINKYIHCVNKPSKTYTDRTILKYSTDFIRSTLIDLYRRKLL